MSDDLRLTEATSLLDRVLHQLNGHGCLNSRTTLHRDIQKFMDTTAKPVKTILDEIREDEGWVDDPEMGAR